MKECDILGGVKTYCAVTPHTYFPGVKTPNPPGSTPAVAARRVTQFSPVVKHNSCWSYDSIDWLIDLYSYKYQTYMYTVPIAKEKTITNKV